MEIHIKAWSDLLTKRLYSHVLAASCSWFMLRSVMHSNSRELYSRNLIMWRSNRRTGNNSHLVPSSSEWSASNKQQGMIIQSGTLKPTVTQCYLPFTSRRHKKFYVLRCEITRSRNEDPLVLSSFAPSSFSWYWRRAAGQQTSSFPDNFPSSPVSLLFSRCKNFIPSHVLSSQWLLREGII